MIEVENVVKNFRLKKSVKGFFKKLKSLFIQNYELKKAVSGITFSIAAGEIVGYIGSNGAGKSTTIKMVSGIIEPSEGKIRVNGLNPYVDRTKNCLQIGVVFGQRSQLWWDLPLYDSFQILKKVYRVSDRDFAERKEYFSNLLGLGEFWDQPVRTLSLGQRMRADIFAALLHNPPILFLDEPTIGLDVHVKERLLAAVKDINQKYQTTIILTTHDLGDIEEICSRIIVLDLGKIIFDDKLEVLRKVYGNRKMISVEFGKIDDIENHKKELVDIVGHDNFKLEIEGNRMLIMFSKERVDLKTVANWAFGLVNVQDVTISNPPIEDLIKQLYSRAILN